jgi:CheY-like chemotaxis protein/HPt (histidine-containing phosphotransfer) domain-containing protein
MEDNLLGETRLFLLSSDLMQRKELPSPHDASRMTFLSKPVRPSQLLDAISAASAWPTNDSAPGKIDTVALHMPDSAAATDCLKNLHVLVVEDNPSNQMVVAAMLKSLGCRFDVAVNGEEAVNMVREVPYDVVLMDCCMPVMDGFEATVAIRRMGSEGRQPTIIALTANAIHRSLKKCLEAGMDDYLSKPIRSRELQLMLERWALPSGDGDSPSLGSERRSWGSGGDVWDGNMFEMERLLELQQMFRKTSKDLLPAVMEPFLQNAEESSIPSFRKAVDQGDFAKIRELAHQLQGGSVNLGMRKLSEICLKLLDNARHKDIESAAKLISHLETEIPLVRVELLTMRKKGLI